MRFALRLFTRRPLVPTLIAGLFALGVGLAGGMWAVIDAAVLRPLPYRDAGALVFVMETHPQRGLMAVPPANFLDWSSRVRGLRDAAGTYAIDASIAGAALPERVSGLKVTERFFDLWGVAPALGRTLQQHDFATTNHVVVVGHAVWQRLFNRDPRVAGTLVRIDGESYTVVGVMPASFRTIDRAEIWIPWTMTADEQRERRFHLVGVMARLRSGVSASGAERELATIYRQLQLDHPDTTAEWTARVLPLRDLLLGDSTKALAVLGGAVIVLLTVAWINVAGLLVAWLPTRRHELVVRMALGATTAVIVRQLMLETLVWAGAGTVGGLVVATWFVHLFGAAGVSTAVPYDFEPRVDARVVVAVAALLLVSVVATALLPSLLAVRRSRDLVPKRTWGSHGLGRRVTVALQVAMSIVLMSSAAGLLLRLQSLSALTTASRASGATVAMEVSLSEIRYADASNQRVFFDRLLAALAARVEIHAVGAASYVPPARPLGNVRFSIEGRAASTDAQTALASAVDPSAFALLDIPLMRGRLIDRRDGAAAPHAAVISAALARRYWPNDDPIGRHITLVGSEKPITIVGVAGDVRQPLSRDPRAESVLYLSYQQNTWPFMTLIVEPSATSAAAIAAVRQEVGRIDPSQAIGAVLPLDEIRTEWLAQPRVQTTIVSLFGIATLLLTLVGLYARVAHSVVVRAREFAIRQALGARPADVVRGLTSDALVVVGAGVAAGFALLPLAAAALRRLIVEAPPFDITIAAPVAAVLLAGALVSAYGPARRAGRLNTAELLKQE